MKRLAMCVTAAVAFAACNSQPRASAAANSTGATAALQPGLYDYHDSQNSDDVTIRHCVTRAEAEDPRLIFSLQDKSCRFPKFVMADGKVDVRMICEQANASRTDIITGTYTPTSFSVDVAINVLGGPQSGTKMNSHLVVKRVGECPAGT
jgi:hypothetical protein